MTRVLVEAVGGLGASALVAAVVLAAGNVLSGMPGPSAPDILLGRTEPLFVEVDPARVDPRDPLVICTPGGEVTECVRAPS